MSMVLIVSALVMGAHSNPDDDNRVVDILFANTWEVEWFEENGKTERRHGTLEISPTGKGVILVFPRGPWTILASRIDEGTPGKMELDIKGGGEFPFEATIVGIYTIRNNRLYFCFVSKGDKLPKDFTTRGNDGRTLLVLKRSQ
jgi:hypothetical protein